MTVATLHYIHDPLCGWCYGAAPLVAAAEALPDLTIELHGGDMLSGHGRRTITAQWRDMVAPHDRRIAALSGQPFGEAYFEGLLRDTTAVLDSTPPITATLAAHKVSGTGTAMLRRIQQAHYLEGRRVADEPVLQALAIEIGLDAEAFAAAYAALAGEPTREHIAASRALLARVGGSGFPTFVWEEAGDRLIPLDNSGYLGRPQDWAQSLRQRMT